MKIFEFSDNVLNIVLEKLNDAEEFIRIAVFQIHLDSLFHILEQKLNQGISIEILTLPFDSINDSISANVIARFNSLLDLGAQIHFCKWNVGDPERTSTAIGRWYSFHGKFIVTDKSAIALSANFTRSNEIDALIVLDNEQQYINQFNEKFDELINLFITENNGFEGTIRNDILNTGIPNINEVFELPNVIQTTIHRNNWIKHYPSSLCPDEIELEDKLYIAPFDIKGRNIYEKLLNEAEDFVYLSAESFTDVDFGMFLRKLRIEKNIDIQLLTGFTSMDFTDRIQKMFRELIADDVKLFTVEQDLHAKLLVTDKHLLIGSINLNKMNLGFNKSRQYWRENTETFFVSCNEDLIQAARIQFENQVSNGIRMETKLAEKVQKEVSNILNKSFNVRAKKEVKELFSKFVLTKEIQVKKDANKLAKITKNLMEHYSIGIANKDTFFMAVILFHLQDRKHTLSELNNKLNRLETISNLDVLINQLRDSDFIEMEDDFIKINIDPLFE